MTTKPYKRMSAEEKARRIKERQRRKSVNVLDTILGFEKASEAAKDTAYMSDFPENLRPLLKCFVDVFGFPQRDVPNGKSKNYSLWISTLGDMYSLLASSSGVQALEAMELSYSRYRELPHHVDSVKSIYKWFRGAVLSLKTRPVLETVDKKTDSEIIPMNKAEMAKRLRMMKK